MSQEAQFREQGWIKQGDKGKSCYVLRAKRSAARDSSRVALLIANSEYLNLEPIPAIQTGTKALGEKLAACGFDVTLLLDPSGQEVRRHLGLQVESGKDLYLVYFAGQNHFDGEQNHLYPTDAVMAGQLAHRLFGISVPLLLSLLALDRSPKRFLLLDLLNWNLTGQGASLPAEQGLQALAVPAGVTLVSAAQHSMTGSSTEPWSDAFMQALLPALEQPGLASTAVFQQVADAVSARTGGKQQAWSRSGTPGPECVFFEPASPVSAGGVPIPPPVFAAGDDPLAWILADRSAKETDADQALRQQAKAGDGRALLSLSSRYRKDWSDLEQARLKAAHLLRLAAETGLPEAMHLLGSYYFTAMKPFVLHGPEALRLFRLAAEAGHAPAQDDMGMMYEEGNEVAADLNEAIRWYQRAAAQGHQPATENLERLAKAAKGK
ncbi:MAG: hypothetical protein RIR00_1236 [Pseudomonadota bacterium]|jgi:hypothetical protein